MLKGTDEFVTTVDSSVPLMHHDLSDLGSLILIQVMPKENTFKKQTNKQTRQSSIFWAFKGNDTCFEKNEQLKKLGPKSVFD